MTITELAEKLYGEWRRWSEVFGASDQVPPQWRHLTTTARGRWERVARTAYDALKQTVPTPDMGEGRPVPDGYVGVPRRGLPLLDGETACPDCDGSGYAADSAVGPVPCTNRVYHP